MFTIIYFIISYFCWAYIHEYSHLFQLKKYKDLKCYKMRLYPHVNKDLGFVFASVSYDYDGFLTRKEEAYVAVAPRIPSFISCLLFPFSHLVEFEFIQIFLMCGVIDMLRSAYNRNDSSDIYRFCKGFKLPIEIIQVITVSVSLLPFVLFYIFR